MDTTVKAVLWLVAVVLAVIAAVAQDRAGRVQLFPLSFAVFVFPFMWDAFEAS